MIEILILVQFVRSLSRIAESKGRSKGWAGLGVLGWIGGEITGAIIGGLTSEGMGSVYAIALLGAVVGSIVAYVIVKNLSVEGAEPERPMTQGALNPNYDPRNPYSPPRIDEK